MASIDLRIEKWKKRLLDLGKRNRLINYRETKRSNIKITVPDIEDLYKRLVINEEALEFPFMIDDNEEDTDSDKEDVVSFAGDLETNRSIKEQLKTLRNLRNKAKTAIEEQGVNILYLSFGFLKWKEYNDSDQTLTSPIVLVPVRLLLESIDSPFVLSLHEDEIVINPTLAHKLENDFGIQLPDFESHDDDLMQYLTKIKKIASKNKWEVENDAGLSLLSFLKINMYKDLDKNKEKIGDHPIIKALSGDVTEIKSLPDEYNLFDHDNGTKPIDIYQVVDADSSQQDAILLSKKDISFVLQGPPGTGKSQTITNIIAEGLADNKKILFVSEKMAALEVVHKRLMQTGLADFCLTLHSYKANKKEVLSELGKTLNINRVKLQEDALYQLDLLKKERDKLNKYDKELHTPCFPLGKSIYEVNGRMAKLRKAPDVIFSFENVGDTSEEGLNHCAILLEELSKTIGKMTEDYAVNPWRSCNVPGISHELRHDIENYLIRLIPKLKALVDSIDITVKDFELEKMFSLKGSTELVETLEIAARSPKIPVSWMYFNDITKFSIEADNFRSMKTEYKALSYELSQNYDDGYFDLPANEIFSRFRTMTEKAKQILNLGTYRDEYGIINFLPEIIDFLESTRNTLETLTVAGEKVAVILGIKTPVVIADYYFLAGLLESLLSNPKPAEVWFDIDKFNTLKRLYTDAKDKFTTIENDIKGLMTDFDTGILNIDHNLMLKRFCGDYNTLPYRLKISYKHQIEKVYNSIGIVLETLESLIKQSEDLTFLTGINKPASINETRELIPLLQLILSTPKPTPNWFDKSKMPVIKRLLNEAKEAHKFIDETVKTVTDIFDRDILSIDQNSMLARFRTDYESFFKHFKGTYWKDKKQVRSFLKDKTIKLTDDYIIDILNKLKLISDKKAWIKDNQSILSEYFGDLYVSEYTDWSIIETSLNKFETILQFFQQSTFPEKLREVLLACGAKNAEIKTVYDGLIRAVDSNIDITLDDLLKLDEVLVSYNLSKLLEIIKEVHGCLGNERADKKLIISLALNPAVSLDDNSIINILHKLKAISENKLWISENNDLMVSLFGNIYREEYTDWAAFEKSVFNFGNILEYFGSNGIPPKTRDILTGGIEEIEKLEPLYKAAKSALDSNKHLVVDRTLNLPDKTENFNIDSLNRNIGDALVELRMLAVEYQGMKQFSRRDIGFDDVIDSFLKLKRVQDIAAQICEQKEVLKDNYQFLFTGIDTDWDTILNSLEWANDFKKLNKKYSLPSSFIERICEDDTSIRLAAERLEVIKHGLEYIKLEWEWYVSMFDDKDELLNANLNALLARIEKCVSDLSALEEWIDFRGCRQKCKEAGLADFIEKIETMKIDRNLILPSFLKRFYRLWLDVMMPKFSAVFSFRRRAQEGTVKEFERLDLTQLSIARSRIRERLISRLPDMNKFVSAVDEVGILKRELNKQRRIMPLRKLFKTIPNLLLTLKPCLMMSPLSVSLFLEADNYDFDIVIFDEASQVCTEDAIGAIMRGTQVVIAGDSKQLPPTSFFTASISDGDFDSDEIDEDEYDDTDAYESILDEAVTILPERTLRWHYRSKHEHLIAFSNAKIYSHSLITFPSHIDKVQDNGVEYIYVSNGVYDRSGKRNNPIEAKKVAEIVFEQVKKYPNRSLGVVTFSEAQQQAVETAVRQLRLQNPQYESFFSEEKEDGFFIKNLENVQGDERDTIIFSIGYAKDQNGVMYMNFGPLSRNGGYRRLNVAITRAKYNVKLVGSIHPTDIKLENTNSEGVKMLRSYIEFAINGTEVLHREISVSETVNTESPFEEAVYDFLVGKGYNVVTQVGCSGYRIDMAVKHPTLSGRFVLGIECDGATYHSARTARERDRLRQAVLEDIGWKIYRIWSTDWIKDPINEGEKLLTVVKNAIAEYIEDNFLFESQYMDINDVIYENKYISIEAPAETFTEEDIDDANPYNFSYYEETDVYEIDRHSDDVIYVTNVLKYVVSNEYPIHFELVCKRVACLFGNQKATSKVRDYVEHVLNKKLKDEIILRDGYCWIKGAERAEVRIPNGKGATRPIGYISAEELAEAMHVITSKSFGIMQDDLYVATARAFGFNRTGGNITKALQAAYEQLINGERIKNNSGKVTVIEQRGF